MRLFDIFSEDTGQPLDINAALTGIISYIASINENLRYAKYHKAIQILELTLNEVQVLLNKKAKIPKEKIKPLKKIKGLLQKLKKNLDAVIYYMEKSNIIARDEYLNVCTSIIKELNLLVASIQV